MDENLHIDLSPSYSCIIPDNSIKEDENTIYSNDMSKHSKQKKFSKMRCRQENSLGEITRSFTKLIKSQKDKILNINDVVKQLKVKKRRIYDITNVLEGNFLINNLIKEPDSLRN